VFANYRSDSGDGGVATAKFRYSSSLLARRYRQTKGIRRSDLRSSVARIDDAVSSVADFNSSNLGPKRLWIGLRPSRPTIDAHDVGGDSGVASRASSKRSSRGLAIQASNGASASSSLLETLSLEVILHQRAARIWQPPSSCSVVGREPSNLFNSFYRRTA